ncbi:MAG: HAMP domain-containing sensor histidine kinase [Pseudomonadota bacterium]
MGSLDVTRTRAFLVTQSLLLAVAVLSALIAMPLNALPDKLAGMTIGFCGMAGVITGVGWYLFLFRGVTTSLAVALLWVDSAVGWMFLYGAGEFETALGIMWFPIVMAPIYTARRHAWFLAGFHVAAFLLLIWCRQSGALDAVLPYGGLLPRAAVTQPAFVLDAVVSFLLITAGMAILAGSASADIMNSQQQLQAKVEEQTSELGARARQLDRARVDLEEQNGLLAETNALLRASNAALEQFSIALGHDLKGPMQTLVGNVDLLLLTPLEPVQRRRVEGLQAGIERMQSLVSALQQLTRVTDRLNSMARVSLDEVAREAVADLQARIEQRGAVVEIGAALPDVMGNRSLLREVFQNLLDNGIKYGASVGPRVLVGAGQGAPGRVVIWVEDDGTGIAPEHAGEVFQLFRRLPEHATREGVGAGLALVRRIVRAHGGEVRVEGGQVLGGARLVVELPAVQ